MQSVVGGPPGGSICIRTSDRPRGRLTSSIAHRKSVVHGPCGRWSRLHAAAAEAQVAEAPGQDDDLVFDVPQHVLQRNAEFAQRLKGQLVLAPLTKGGNLPFRQLCAQFGADVTMSEMAFARPLLKGDRVERARLLKAPNEHCYGVQVATKSIAEGLEAAALAHQSGATWLDINVGCPIYEASRRGLGAVLLRKPRGLARLVAGIARDSPIPVTVKIRTGESGAKLNVVRVVGLLARTGAAAVTVHGRTMEQRYRRPADWDVISRVAADNTTLPVIGNGDVLTHYDVARRFAGGPVHAVMTGRGALIRPWLFAEAKQGRELDLTAVDRVGIYRNLVTLMKSHFGDSAVGRRKAWYFLPWHFTFLCRYRRFPEAVYSESAAAYPLMCTRVDTCDPRLGEELDALDPLERLLRCESEAAHAEIAGALWDAADDADAEAALRKLAAERLLEWEEAVRVQGQREPGRGGGLGGRKGGARSDEEY